MFDRLPPLVVLLLCGGCFDPPTPRPWTKIDTSRPNDADAHDVAWVRGFIDGRRQTAKRDDPSWWCMERTNYADGYRFGHSREILWYFAESDSYNSVFEQEMLRHRRRLAMAEKETVLRLWISSESGGIEAWVDWCRRTGTTPSVPGCFSAGDLPSDCHAIYAAEKPKS